jgi:leucyl aminopeptidase (aminopeptidase T)
MMGITANIVIMPPLERDYADPTGPAMAACEAANIIHYITFHGMMHSRFGRKISRMKKKRIVSEGITREMLTRGAVFCDMASMNKVNQKINEMWDKGSRIHITTSLGTDLTVSIEGRYGFVGLDNKPRSHVDLGAGAAFQFPGGEAPIAPLEDTAEGVIVVDKTMHYPHGLLSEPIRLEIHKGTITRISGGEEAEAFERWLQSYSDPGGYRLCEVSCGTNEKAVWMGSMRQDRFVLGGMHCGFGTNADVGGTIDSNIHYDVIFSKASLKVDGKKVLENGMLMI